MKLTPEKIKELEAKGFKTGTVAEFLGLTPEDEAWIEMKLALRNKVVEMRNNQQLTQADFARKLGSSQSRVSKIEAGDSTVGYDLLVKSLLVLGASPEQIGAAIASAGTGRR